MPIIPYWTSCDGVHDDKDQAAVGVVFEKICVKKLRGSVSVPPQQSSTSPGTTTTTATIPCEFVMEVRKNGKKYQEDSCGAFMWNQTYEDGSTAPISMFAVADGHSNRQAASLYYTGDPSQLTEDGGELSKMVIERMRDAFEATLETLPSDCWKTDVKTVKKRLEEQGAVVDESIREDGLGQNSGTTFSFVLVTQSHVALGNVGDSIGYYVSFNNGKVGYPISATTFGVDTIVEDKEWKAELLAELPHLEQHESEQRERFLRPFKEIERVEKAGCSVGRCHISNGTTSLQVTRSFGDFDFKDPTLVKKTVNPESGGGPGDDEKEPEAVSTAKPENVDCTGLGDDKCHEFAVSPRPEICILERTKNEDNEVVGLFSDGIVFPYTESGSAEPEKVSLEGALRKVSVQIGGGGSDLGLTSSKIHNSAASRRRWHLDNSGSVIVKLLKEVKVAEEKEEGTKEASAVLKNDKDEASFPDKEEQANLLKKQRKM